MQRKPKKSQKPKPPVKVGEPVFSYTSVCHSVQAVKTPLTNPHDMDAAKLQSLGTFRCSQCNKKCKCTRSKYTPSPKEAGESNGKES